MNRFDGKLRWVWCILVVSTMAFALGGCEGSDGAAGAAGATGPTGATGPVGPSGPVPDDVTAAIEAADVESCGTCHDGAGTQHQDVYNAYTDASAFVLTIDDFASVAAAGGRFDVTLDFSITQNGAPYIDPVGIAPSVDSLSFYVVEYDSGLDEFLQPGFSPFPSISTAGATSNGDGTYTLLANVEFNPLAFDGGAIIGQLGDGTISFPDNPTSNVTHIHMYTDLSHDAYEIGTINTWDSTANVSGCEACHGTPYRKHGNVEAIVAGVPDFARCKTCHFDDRVGGHEDWQYMVDEPLNWATSVASTADYSYTANIMNVTHMSHAMEFPYPQSMSNCSTCHAGKLDQVIIDANFTAETCKSCHAVQGIDAAPGETYAQGNRAPPLQYLWDQSGFAGIHDINDNCSTCHSDPLVFPFTGIAARFDEMHTGYDVNISNAAGQKYADLYTVAIDDITISGSVLTVDFSSNDPAVVPELLVSLYGWVSKNFIVASHSSDGSSICLDRRGNAGGCRMEYTPESSGGSANPLFTEDTASVVGDWRVSLDLAAYLPTAFLPEDIPTMIADGTIKMAEITITPEAVINGTEVVLRAANETFDLGGSMIVPDYFKGANATVSTDKCNVCHDALASSFHSESGRGGEGIEVCKNCHVTTSPGSHLELQSRAIDSYVHGIHSFQVFDLDDVAAANDPVEDARAAQHALHTFPNFTITNCEACHLDGTYNVPDQSKSMPGVLSKSWTIADRNIGTVPESVTGPAVRACGACHRADLINADLAGDLATLNAHHDAFGTFEANDDDDLVLYGIIDKIMSMFE